MGINRTSSGGTDEDAVSAWSHVVISIFGTIFLAMGAYAFYSLVSNIEETTCGIFVGHGIAICSGTAIGIFLFYIGKSLGKRS